MSALGLQQAVDIDIQAAGPGIGLLAVRHLQGNPARPFDGNVEVATGVHDRTLVENIGNRGIDHHGPRRHAIALHRHSPETVFLSLETHRAGIGQIVGGAGLLHENMLGAGHGGVDQAIHGVFRSGRQLTHVDQGLHDLILRLDRLGVGLVVTLGGDEIHQFLSQVHVGIFHCR